MLTDGTCAALVLRSKPVIAALSRTPICEIYAGLRRLATARRATSSKTLICATNAKQASERDQSPENGAGVYAEVVNCLLVNDLTKLMSRAN